LTQHTLPDTEADLSASIIPPLQFQRMDSIAQPEPGFLS
jgi:hypothetical protein